MLQLGTIYGWTGMYMYMYIRISSQVLVISTFYSRHYRIAIQFEERQVSLTSENAVSDHIT